MTALTWDATGEKFYQIGVDRGVFYPNSGPGVAWNGLTSVSEQVVGGAVTPYYIDGIKHLDVLENEDFKATLTAYMAPEEFLQCDGTWNVTAGLRVTNQPRSSFGLSYRTRIGNDLSPQQAYKIHLLYNAMAAPVQKTYTTLGASSTVTSFDWELTAVPISGLGFKPAAHFEIISSEIPAPTLALLEDILYGSSALPPRMLTIAEIAGYISTSDGPITDPIAEPV